MLDFLEIFQRVFKKESVSSKKVAKERLRLVLVHDRTSMSPQVLEFLKEDLIKVISKYMDIDTEGLEVNFSKEDDSIALVASIPVIKVKRLSTS